MYTSFDIHVQNNNKHILKSWTFVNMTIEKQSIKHETIFRIFKDEELNSSNDIQEK